MHQARAIARKAYQRDGDKHNCLCKNDRHHTGCIDFQRYVLACTTVLTVADNTLGVLYGHFTCPLYQKHCTDGNGKQQHNFDDEHHKTAFATTGTGQTGSEFVEQCRWESGNDTYQDDEGDTVAYTAVGDTLAQPHDEHGAGCEDDGQVDDVPEPESSNFSTISLRKLVLEVDQIGGCLHKQDQHCQITGVLGQFLTSALAFTLHLLERRKHHAEELDNDGGSDVGHNTQGKY